MKICFKCNTLKPLSEYYKHSQMADGHLNKCKSCTKKDVSKHRVENAEKIREYDRNRPNKSERIENQTKYTKDYRAKFSNKYKAHNAVNNAVRRGDIVKETTCSQCPSDFAVVAHHDDYSKPLEIRWLCEVCHKAWHNENGEGLNGS